MDVDAARGARAGEEFRPSPVRELRDSLVLLGLVVSSLGAYVGIGALMVRVLAGS